MTTKPPMLAPGTYSFEFRPTMLAGTLITQTALTCRCGFQSEWETSADEVLLTIADHEDEEHR